MPGSPPHSVNNLLVADLGNKEAILCACDDGDVLAFWTDQIYSIIERYAGMDDLGLSLLQAYWRRHNQGIFKPASNVQKEEYVHGTGQTTDHEPCLQSNPAKSHSSNLKPFFHVNVGMSAWGLAVHSDLRLIAISSNTHSVRVYAFALESPKTPSLFDSVLEDGGIDEDTESWDILDRGKGSLLHDRERNQCRILSRHLTNIPAIGFDNSSAVRGILVSTDISGRVISWDVDTGEALHDMYSDDVRDLDLYSAGWGVLCIDQRAFFKAADVINAMGLCYAMSNYDLYIADISASRLNVRNAGAWKSDDLTPRRIVAQRSRLGTDAPDSNISDIPTNEDCTLLNDEPDAAREMLVQTDCSDLTHLYRRNKQGEIPHTFANHFSALSRDQIAMLDMSSLFSTNVEPLTLTPVAIKTPLLLLQPQSVHLFQSLDLRHRSVTAPVVFLRDPLYQPTDEGLALRLQRNDRMNLHCQIHELGVVLVGSPKGRVAVFTLWKLEDNPFFKTSEYTIRRDINAVCTLRLDHLLPLKHQEVAGMRPMMQLVGLAASPVQGPSLGEKRKVACRRWRVMLMYRDHTVLSYELSRPPNTAFEGVALS